jgi:ubiquitin C-terminal hydrolase
MKIAQARKDRVKMDSGQQDAHEGLMMFLDAMETIPEVRRLFEHRYKIEIKCYKCGKIIVDRKETNLYMDVQPDLKTDQGSIAAMMSADKFQTTKMDLVSFIRHQSGVHEGFTCTNPECKDKGDKLKTSTLCMVPEILPILIKKYLRKTLTLFPATLEFLGKGNTKKYTYVLVAQSEHAGSMGGGHYWAICRRKDGWKTLNDTSVSPGSPGPTENTYILFYHFLSVSDVGPDDPLVQAAIASHSV